MHIEKYLNLKENHKEIVACLQHTSNHLIREPFGGPLKPLHSFCNDYYIEFHRFADSLARIIYYHKPDKDDAIIKIQYVFMNRFEEIAKAADTYNRKHQTGNYACS